MRTTNEGTKLEVRLARAHAQGGLAGAATMARAVARFARVCAELPDPEEIRRRLRAFADEIDPLPPNVIPLVRRLGEEGLPRRH
jgi:hypothetical protein